jgi:transcription elongation factor GreA
MTHKPVFITAEGLAKLQAELEYLTTVRRHEVAERIYHAKEAGDITDNAEYEDAKNEQAFLEGRILTLEAMLRHAQIIDENQGSEIVTLGSSVTVMDDDGYEETYTIVGSAEADPSQGRISNESPVGRALLGRRVGEEARVLAPAGEVKLRITALNARRT